MEIVKKVKCNHCAHVLEFMTVSSTECSCGKVKISRGLVTEGSVGTDYIDVSPVLLQE